jgi:hypothetical protein
MAYLLSGLGGWYNQNHLHLCVVQWSFCSFGGLDKMKFNLVITSVGTIIRGTLKTPNSQLVTPISIKLQRPDGYD